MLKLDGAGDELVKPNQSMAVLIFFFFFLKTVKYFELGLMDTVDKSNIQHTI